MQNTTYGEIIHHKNIIVKGQRNRFTKNALHDKIRHTLTRKCETVLSERDLAELKKGLVDLIVLYLLRDEDMYAYQLTQEIPKRSKGNFPVSASALYTVLYRLEKDGYVSREIESGVTRPRSYYHLEPSGRAMLEELLKAYNTFHQGLRSIAEDAIL